MLATLSEVLQWTWELSDPFMWIIQSSVDGETEWEDVDSTDGSNRVFGPPGPSELYYRIRGADSESNPVTEWSNIVLLNVS